MANPEVCITVLLPLKNHHPRLLAEALGSVFAQSSSDWRMLVIVEPEDEARFRGLLSEPLGDPRVHLVLNRGRKLAGAFNTGMRAAETEFVAILLSDDLWEPHAVEMIQARIRAHPEVDLFHSGRRIIDGEGRPIGSMQDPPDRVSPDDFIWQSPARHLLCWRRAKALSFGGMDETINNVGPDDYDFPWTMSERGAVFQAIHECLYVYRDHREAYRLTTDLPRSVHLRELRRILRKHGVDPALIERRLSSARESFLRQCHYRNEIHRRLKNLIGFDARSGWHDEYE